MLRFVFLASFGAIAFQSAHADEPPVSAISPVTAPASSIARSPFALAQRDEARLNPTVSGGKLQATVPESLASTPLNPVVASAASPANASQIPSPPSSRPVASSPSKASHPKAGRVSKISTQAARPLHNAASSTISLPKTASLGHRSPQPEGTRLAALPFSTQSLPDSMPPLPRERAVPRVGPKTLSSRDMNRLRSYDLALESEQINLGHAKGRLTRYQQQLGVFTSALSQAMEHGSDDGTVLNPFVRVARRYKGTPYVWGGESARGFDCSGFIMRVMRDLGYRALPHSAAEQFNYGMPVAREALKPGDIVFFANTYKRGVSHVGIYLGGRQFIHAANSRVGTIVSSIDEPKWIEHYAGARRLLITRS